MNEHELLNPYTVKALEYALAISYLLLFIPFWRFVQGEAVPAHALGFGWFQVPNGVHLHAGHAWARPEGGAGEVPFSRDRRAGEAGPEGLHDRGRRPAARRALAGRRPRRRVERSRSRASGRRAARPIRCRLAHEGRAALADRQPQEPFLGRRGPPVPRRRGGEARPTPPAPTRRRIAGRRNAGARHRASSRRGPLGRAGPAVPRGKVRRPS